MPLTVSFPARRPIKSPLKALCRSAHRRYPLCHFPTVISDVSSDDATQSVILDGSKYATGENRDFQVTLPEASFPDWTVRCIVFRGVRIS